jgi:hypothetical protein
MTVRGSIYPVLLGIVIALASVLVVSNISLQNVVAQCTTLLRDSDLDIAEAAEAGNATMVGATNQTTTDGNMTEVEFLSIQNAKSGSISQINATAYTLVLSNVANKTIQFSDRPERVVETVSTSDFVGNWSADQNSFSADEPNDALIVENTQTHQLETAIVESFNPVYDMATNSLTYTIMAENGTSIDLPSQFEQSILVTDEMCCLTHMDM